MALQSYVYLQHMPTELSRDLNETFVQRYDVKKEETLAIDYIQRRVSTYYSKFPSHLRDFHNSVRLLKLLFCITLVIEDTRIF